MKTFIFLVGCFLVSNAHATPYLHCFTDKQEINPSDSSFMAGDSNQRIDLKLTEKINDGKKTLVSRTAQILNYQFSQSTGGESPWSLVVNQVTIVDSQAKLELLVKNGNKTYLTTTVNLEIGAKDSVVAILNHQLAINGQQVVYKMSDDQINEFFAKVAKLVRLEKLVLNDLAILTVENCKLIER
jgi:hypothetical protein